MSIRYTAGGCGFPTCVAQATSALFVRDSDMWCRSCAKHAGVMLLTLRNKANAAGHRGGVVIKSGFTFDD